MQSEIEERQAEKKLVKHMLQDGVAYVVRDVEGCKKLKIQSKAFESTAIKSGVNNQYRMNTWCSANDACFTFIKLNKKEIKDCIKQGLW